MEKTIEMKGVDLGSFFGPADTNLKLLENNSAIFSLSISLVVFTQKLYLLIALKILFQ